MNIFEKARKLLQKNKNNSPIDKQHQSENFSDSNDEDIVDFGISIDTLIPYVMDLAKVVNGREFESRLSHYVRTLPELLSNDLNQFLKYAVDDARRKGQTEMAEAVAVCRQRLSDFRGAHPEIQVLDLYSEEDHLLDKFIDTDSWGAAKDLILANPKLLSDDIEVKLRLLIQQQKRSGNQQAFSMLTEHLQVLRDCRRLGIEAAFSKTKDGKKLQLIEAVLNHTEILSPELLVQSLTSVKSLNELHELIGRLSEFLSDDFDQFLETSIEAARRADNFAEVDFLVFYRRILFDCRAMGVSAAFTKRLSRQFFPIDEVVLAFLEADSIQSRTILEEHPELLTAYADIALQSFICNAQKSSSLKGQQAAELGSARLELLRRCNEIGVDSAFVEYTQSSEQAEDYESPTILVLNYVPLHLQAPLSELMTQGKLMNTEEFKNIIAKDPELGSAIRQAFVTVPKHLRSIIFNINNPPLDILDLPRYLDNCRKALELDPPESDLALWVSIHQMAGNTLSSISFGNQAENLEQAILHHNAAIRPYSKINQPVLWAMSNYNLALVLRRRIYGALSDNLRQASKHLEAALEVYEPEHFPFQWGCAKLELAIVLVNSAWGDPVSNQEQAILHCQDALKILSRDEFPYYWANLNMILADCYAKRIKGMDDENLRNSLKYSEYALQIFTYQAYPKLWADLQHNLGEMWLRHSHGTEAENFEQALTCYEASLNVYDRQQYPRDWAQAQWALGNTWANRINGIQIENAQKAMKCYNAALEFFSLETTPREWGNIHTALLSLYSKRIHYDSVYSLDLAIKHAKTALGVQTIERFPADRWETLTKLGELYFSQRNWEKAYETFLDAITTGNTLFTESYTERGRQSQVTKISPHYTSLAYCLLQMGEPEKALIQLEQGKTRLLSEALALNDLDLKSLSSEWQHKMVAAREKVHTYEAEMRASLDNSVSRIDLEVGYLLAEARTELNQLIAEIRGEYPDFMSTELDIASILNLIPADSVMVIPIVTIEGSAIFVIPSGINSVENKHVIFLDKLRKQDVESLLTGHNKEQKGFEAYFEYRMARTSDTLTKWQETLDEITNHLWNYFIEPIDTSLKELHAKRILLLPHGMLRLLPLHAAWHEVDGDRHYLIDDYIVNYAPSIAILKASQRRAKRSVEHNALVVGVGTYERFPPLSHAIIEAKAIGSLLGTTPLLDHEATCEAVISGSSNASYVHLACHGEFAWNKDLLSSALYLFDDTPLTLADIIGKLNLKSVQLVTLSACESGMTDLKNSSEEYIGLPAAFIEAGAAAIVSSLWAVEERSTYLLMENFYRNHLEKGKSFVEALRDAQLWLRKITRTELAQYYKEANRMDLNDAQKNYIEVLLDGAPDDKPYANSYYWAAFMFSGV
jgi:CHAT domain-containing protein